MEAATLRKKKSISKGKIKKTIRNVISRPDPLYWPILSDDQDKAVETALSKLKVEIAHFKKPHWREIKAIPKDKRPKPPPIVKVDGLVFGISETNELIKNGQCSAVLLDSEVNPQIIVQPLLDACINSKVDVVCLKNLRKTCLNCFGLCTSCLGVKSGYLLDLSEVICGIARNNGPPQIIKEDIRKIEVPEKPLPLQNFDIESPNSKPIYLYRTDKKSRVFVPGDKVANDIKRFIGQDFIEFTDKEAEKPNKAYMKMILKRISNNPNRVKRK